jgi:3-hydroxyisobutyrate dehydrogenase-like beta-hydroxyacid dehydrogenase
VTSVAFFGIGLMGEPMAARLLDAGHEVAVWNRTAARTEGLAARGARAAPTASEAASGAEVAITMLSDADAVEAVLFGPHGTAAALGPDAALIEMSTIGPDAARSIGERLEGPMLDAPVLGGVAQARDGSLRIVVGGDAAAFERCRALLDALGEPIHVGEAGAGAAMKLVANSCTASLSALLGEALALADRLDLDQSVTLDALSATALQAFIARRRPEIESGSFPPAFRLALAHKDLRLVLEAAAARGSRMDLSEAARRRYAEAEAAGFGGLDFGALTAHIRGLDATE